MSMKRYFVNLSYIGTQFRGSQRQVKGGTPRPNDPTTVQGLLEMGLKDIIPTRDTVVFMASRTDAGVHALNTTCHFDLPSRNDDTFYDPTTIMSGLNSFLFKRLVPIRVLNTRNVSNEFHSRNNAISRTYLYRLIIGICEEPKLSKLLHFFPIEELGRAHFHCTTNLDLDTMREAGKMLEGFHDFRTFKGKTPDDDRLTRREIYSIKIVERRKDEIGICSPFSWPSIAVNNDESHSHVILDVFIKGKGFLYKQVRRTAGTLLAAATGQISLKDIRFMLEVPSKHSWIPSIKVLPGCGLYLCEIEY